MDLFFLVFLLHMNVFIRSITFLITWTEENVLSVFSFHILEKINVVADTLIRQQLDL